MFEGSLSQFTMDGFDTVNNHIILGVKAGRGFGFLDKSFMIEANLNGHILETDTIQPANEVIIGAELLWEAGKRVLKRLRTGNVPLKVDCFTVVNGQKQEKLGYVLMALRAAQATESNNTVTNYSGSWHTILGVKTDVKPYNPALYLSLCIEEMKIEGILHTSKIPADINSDSSKSNYISQYFSNKSLVHISSRIDVVDFFLLTVTLESAGSLQLLADHEHERDSMYNFSCSIMGHEKHIGTIPELSPFIPNIPNEKSKFEIKMCSSLKSLLHFFQRRDFACIKLMSDDQEIAFGEINGSCFVQINDLHALCTHHSSNNKATIKTRCYLMKSCTHEIPGSPNGLRPYVDVDIMLQYLFVHNSQEVHKFNENKSNTLHASSMPINFKTDNAQCFRDNNTDGIDKATYDLQYNIQSWCTIKIVVESILLHQNTDVDTFNFRFHQAKATTVWRQHQKVVIKNVNQFISVKGVICSLFLEGSRSDVELEVITHKPMVVLYSSLDSDCEPIAYGVLDIKPLLESQMPETYTLGLRRISRETKYGLLKLNLILENVMISNGVKRKNVLSPDRKISSLLLDPATVWKHKCEECNEYRLRLFMAEMKKMKHDHLNEVLENWEHHRKEYESNVKTNVQRCTELATSLNEAVDEVHSQSYIITQKEIELSHIEDTLQCEFKLKLEECREASRRMKDDFELEISKLQMENMNLQKLMALREEENAQYLKEIGHQNDLLDNMEKDFLTEEQTTTLLKELKTTEEKYIEAYRSKLFFKDQWARVMREIHCIKTGNREDINLQIRTNKKELKNLGIMLPACESSGLHELELQAHQDSEIKYSNLQLHTGELISNLDVKSIANSYCSSLLDREVEYNIEKSSLEHTLQELVEERDGLLNTGTYSLDHVLISNLNKQIRQILAQCNRTFV